MIKTTSIQSSQIHQPPPSTHARTVAGGSHAQVDDLGRDVGQRHPRRHRVRDKQQQHRGLTGESVHAGRRHLRQVHLRGGLRPGRHQLDGVARLLQGQAEADPKSDDERVSSWFRVFDFNYRSLPPGLSMAECWLTAPVGVNEVKICLKNSLILKSGIILNKTKI